MASIDTLISVAEECVGMNLKECVKHFDTSDPGVDWCAWFVRQCGAKADMNFGSSNTASKLWGLNGNFAFVGSNFPKEGDLAFIDPKGNDNTGVNIAAFLDFFIPTCVHSIVSRVFDGLALGVRRAGEIHKLNVRCLGLDDIYISTGVVIHISNTRMRHKISPFKCLI